MTTTMAPPRPVSRSLWRRLDIGWNLLVVAWAALTLVVPDLLPWGDAMLAFAGSAFVWVVILSIWGVRAVRRDSRADYGLLDVLAMLVTPAVFAISLVAVFSGAAEDWRMRMSLPSLAAVVAEVRAGKLPREGMIAGLERVEVARVEDDAVVIQLGSGSFIFPFWYGVRWDPTPDEYLLDDRITGDWYRWEESD